MDYYPKSERKLVNPEGRKKFKVESCTKRDFGNDFNRDIKTEPKCKFHSLVFNVLKSQHSSEKDKNPGGLQQCLEQNKKLRDMGENRKIWHIAKN